jgi:hypothetical protein
MPSKVLIFNVFDERTALVGGTIAQTMTWPTVQYQRHCGWAQAKRALNPLRSTVS